MTFPDEPAVPAEAEVLGQRTSLPPSAAEDVPPVAPPRGASMVRLSTLTLLLASMIMLLVLPRAAEQLQYSLTRGQQRAKAEVARKLLAESPPPEARFAYVAKSIAPSVVGIETTQVADNPVTDESAHLFGRPDLRTEGIGSGVIVDTKGYIVTNYHVIEQAAEITVKLSDGSQVKDVKVVGVDPLSDLAVLKIKADRLVAAPWGDSGELEVGEPVLAVGNPYGLARTVTAGIISATDRRANIARLAHQDFVQTDAAINPGNSGGPLVNMRGQVVGINTAIYGPRNLGISFAIPSRLAQDVYQRLKTTGKVARGWLGVAMLALDDEVAQREGLSVTQGALVTEVLPRSPAAGAGLEPGDVIIRWNDQQVDEPSDLSRAVVHTKIGSKATVVVLRKDRAVEFTVEVGERPVQLSR